MSTFSFFDPTTGRLTGAQFSGPPALLAANTPDGLQAIEGAFDYLRQRVDLVSGEVVAWQPPRPDDTEFEVWAWDELELVWVASPTAAALARDVRAERDRRLAACDWVVVRSTDLGEPIPPEWTAYRVALRDLPDQAGFPSEVTWPTPP